MTNKERRRDQLELEIHLLRSSLPFYNDGPAKDAQIEIILELIKELKELENE